MFDAFLLQQGATSMLDARDAMLAADRMRFGGKDLKVMWDAFAARGMGQGASTPNADSGDPKPSFASPRAKQRQGPLPDARRRPGSSSGDYEARVDAGRRHDPEDRSSATRSRLAPGRYQMLYVSRDAAASSGSRSRSRRASDRTVRGRRADEPRRRGRRAPRSSAPRHGSLNPKFLIDGTEATDWGGVTDGNVDATHPFVAVDLAGGVHTVRRVQVSAMLNPAPGERDRRPARRRPGLRVAVHRAAPVRPRGVRQGVRVVAGAKWKRFYTSSGQRVPGDARRARSRRT